MNEMVEKILDIRAIESQVIKFYNERFDISEEIQSYIEQFLGRAKQKSIQIHDTVLPVFVILDKNYFGQVIDNLISNAIKFSPTGKSIFISTYQKDGSGFFEIRDEGPGFTAEDKKKIFGKYQKLSARPTGGESSTGIGLSIVKKYVEAMGGNITYESEPGKGTMFRVEFMTTDE